MFPAPPTIESAPKPPVIVSFPAPPVIRLLLALEPFKTAPLIDPEPSIITTPDAATALALPVSGIDTAPVVDVTPYNLPLAIKFSNLVQFSAICSAVSLTLNP